MQAIDSPHVGMSEYHMEMGEYQYQGGSARTFQEIAQMSEEQA
jgi:hypothetical protein